MKKYINLRKIASVSLAFLISSLHVASAMDNHQMRAEVERVLEKFQRNMGEYYQRTRMKKKPIEKGLPNPAAEPINDSDMDTEQYIPKRKNVKMAWPQWIPETEQRNITGKDPASRGRRLFAKILDSYNTYEDHVGFTRFLNNLRPPEIDRATPNEPPVFCVMKDKNSPQTPWIVRELVGDVLTTYNPFRWDGNFSVDVRGKCIDYVTKDNPIYELLPDETYTQEDRRFYVYKLKTPANGVHDDFYLVEGNWYFSVPNQPTISTFTEFLNQLDRGEFTDFRVFRGDYIFYLLPELPKDEELLQGRIYLQRTDKGINCKGLSPANEIVEVLLPIQVSEDFKLDPKGEMKPALNLHLSIFELDVTNKISKMLAEKERGLTHVLTGEQHRNMIEKYKLPPSKSK